MKKIILIALLVGFCFSQIIAQNQIWAPTLGSGFPATGGWGIESSLDLGGDSVLFFGETTVAPSGADSTNLFLWIYDLINGAHNANGLTEHPNGLVQAAVRINDTTIFIGGTFDSVGLVPMPNSSALLTPSGYYPTTMFNGNYLDPLVAGSLPHISSLAVIRDTLFAGGGFFTRDSLGNQTSYCMVAKWHPAIGGWAPLPYTYPNLASPGVGIEAMCTKDDTLFVGNNDLYAYDVSTGAWLGWYVIPYNIRAVNDILFVGDTLVLAGFFNSGPGFEESVLMAPLSGTASIFSGIYSMDPLDSLFAIMAPGIDTVDGELYISVIKSIPSPFVYRRVGNAWEGVGNNAGHYPNGVVNVGGVFHAYGRVSSSLGTLCTDNPKYIARLIDTTCSVLAIPPEVEPVDTIIAEIIQPVAYPNPVQDFLNIKVPEGWKGLVTAQIFAMDGKLVFSEKYDEQLFQVQASSLPSAMYLLRLRDQSGKHWNKKVVKD